MQSEREIRFVCLQLSLLLVIIIAQFRLYHCNIEPQCEFNPTNDETINEECFENEEHRSLMYTETSRYLLYDVNHVEGFNLRRDVYMRMAQLTSRLGPRWVLVLPEWAHLPQWRVPSHKLERSRKWSTYFDLRNMRRFVPLLELHELSTVLNQSKIQVDTVLSLEHSEHFHENEFVELYDIKEVNKSRNYQRKNGIIVNVADPMLNKLMQYYNLYEVQLEGFESTMAKLIEEYFPTNRVVLISNAEVVLHANYGDQFYWMARRSMRIANHLLQQADQYRLTHLNSSNQMDGTELNEDWRRTLKIRGTAHGGPYIAVHFRRADFLLYRGNRVPGVDCAAHQIRFAASNFMEDFIENIYISTDTDEAEYSYLKKALERKGHKVFNYQHDVSSDIVDSLTPGEGAIIDQWISAHAKLFVGTLESTFTYRIQEDREIMGFAAETTFNALCPQCDLRLMLKLCKPDSTWKIIY